MIPLADPRMVEARVQANRRASREGVTVCIWERVYCCEREIYVRAEYEGPPDEGAELVERVGLVDARKPHSQPDRDADTTPAGPCACIPRQGSGG